MKSSYPLKSGILDEEGAGVAQPRNPIFRKQIKPKGDGFARAGEAFTQRQASKIFDIELYCMSFVQGNFERAIETAGEHGPELKHKYVALQATNFIRDGKSLDALKLYRRHSAPPYEQVIITW